MPARYTPLLFLQPKARPLPDCRLISRKQIDPLLYLLPRQKSPRPGNRVQKSVVQLDLSKNLVVSCPRSQDDPFLRHCPLLLQQLIIIEQAGTTSVLNRRPSHTPGPRQGSESSNDGTVYCICRGPDDHRMMVNCEGGCEEWYHCSCVDINEEDAKKLLDRFICPKCATPELFTTYRRLCRNFNIKDANGNPTCREPARVTAEPPSKYCSDKCKAAFWANFKTRLRQDNDPSVGGALNIFEVARIFKEKKTLSEFQKLGQKPRLLRKEETDPSKYTKSKMQTRTNIIIDRAVGLDYLNTEEKGQLENIKKKQTVIEARIKIYRQQYILLRKVLERQVIAAQQPGLDLKDACLYDNRLSLNEVEFREWAETEEGKNALAPGVPLGPQTAATRQVLGKRPYASQSIPDSPILPAAVQDLCLRPKKRCKHFNWLKIHNDEFLSTQKRLQDQSEALSTQVNEIIDGAETRETMGPYYKDNTVTLLF